MSLAAQHSVAAAAGPAVPGRLLLDPHIELDLIIIPRNWKSLRSAAALKRAPLFHRHRLLGLPGRLPIAQHSAAPDYLFRLDRPPAPHRGPFTAAAAAMSGAQWGLKAFCIACAKFQEGDALGEVLAVAATAPYFAIYHAAVLLHARR